MEPKSIIHLDMDAFYAAVEVLDEPELKGKPVIVGGNHPRGVVSTCSYEARKFGVHSAMPSVTAARLCPQAVFRPVRMGRYKEMSDRIFDIFRRFTPLVEPLSLDEAFLDVTASIRLFGHPPQIAADIKRLVRSETGLTVSAGVAPSKLVAKIASDLHKPDGLTVVPPDRVREFLDPLPIGRLWGVGKVSQRALAVLGVETIGDLHRLPPDLLRRKFGESGVSLHRLAQGLDDRPVEPTRDAKSIGAEETYLEDIRSLEPARRELLALTLRAARRLRRHGFVCRTVTLKVKYHDFKQITRAETLGRPTDDTRRLYAAVVALLAKTDVGRRPVRLLGVSFSGLGLPDENRQPSLFDEEEKSGKLRELDRALDRISDKYGSRAVIPATLLEDDS